MSKQPERDDLRVWLQTIWQDIHHSRNQEWQCLQIVIWIFIGLMGLSTLEEVKQRALYFSVAAMFTSLVGFGITWHHRLLFNEQIYIVNRIGDLLGIDYQKYKKEYEEQKQPRNRFSKSIHKMGEMHIGPFRVGCTSSLIASIYVIMFFAALIVGVWSRWLGTAPVTVCGR